MDMGDAADTHGRILGGKIVERSSTGVWCFFGGAGSWMMGGDGGMDYWRV